MYAKLHIRRQFYCQTTLDFLHLNQLLKKIVISERRELENKYWNFAINNKLLSWGVGCRNVRIEGQKEKNFSSYPFQIKTINLQRAFVIINYYSLLYRITSSSQEKSTTKKTWRRFIFKYSKSAFENLRYWVQLLIKNKVPPIKEWIKLLEICIQICHIAPDLDVGPASMSMILRENWSKICHMPVEGGTPAQMTPCIGMQRIRQTLKMESFAKIVHGFKSSTIPAKCSS